MHTFYIILQYYISYRSTGIYSKKRSTTIGQVTNPYQQHMNCYQTYEYPLPQGPSDTSPPIAILVETDSPLFINNVTDKSNSLNFNQFSPFCCIYFMISVSQRTSRSVGPKGYVTHTIWMALLTGRLARVSLIQAQS